MKPGRVLAGLTLVLALLSASMWASGRWAEPYRVMFDVPLAPGHSLHVHIANHQQPRLFDAYLYYSLARLPISPTPRVDVWYQRQRVWAGTHLASFQPPAWPLVAMTLIPAVLALPAIARRRHG